MSWRRFFQRHRADEARAEEMQAHLDAAIDYLIERGMTPDEARREARLRFGNPRAHRERVDDLKRLPILDTLARDVTYAWRIMRRTPAFSLTVVATLALVIGANTAVLSVADHVLFRPLPYPHPERLVTIEPMRVTSQGTASDGAIDGRIFAGIRDHVRALDIAAFSGLSNGVNFNHDGAAAFVRQARVSSGYFRVLGVPVQIGRELSLDEDHVGGPRAAVISDALWRRTFNADPAVLGRTMLLRGEPYLVVGVAAPGFIGPIEADVWTALMPSTAGEGANPNYASIARIADGFTREQAVAQLRAISSPELMRSGEPRGGQLDQWLEPRDLQASLVEGQRVTLSALGAAVALVLVIACINIAALLLARGGERRKELATRMALGSGRAAVVRQLLVESVVLALAGGAAGLALGIVGLRALQALAGDIFTDWQHVTIDARVVAITAVIAILTSLLFGLVPAWQASRLNVQQGLLEGGSRSIAGSSRSWLRRSLVVAEVALGVVLLVCAALLLRTFASLSYLDRGRLDIDKLTTASVSLEDARYTSSERITALFDRSLERLAATPGIESAAVTLELPFARLLNMGGRLDGDTAGRMMTLSYVTPDFTGTFGLPILRGRALSASDRAGSANVVLVNESFARLYSPDREVVGRHVRIASDTREIVGVIPDVPQRQSFFTDGMVRGPIATLPSVYAPASQLDDSFFALVHQWFQPVWTVRAAPGVDVARAVRDAVGAVDSGLPVAAVQPLSAIKAESLALQRMMMVLVGATAAVALLLAALGLHGLIAHTIAERRREFGIRLALGATYGQSIRAIAASGLWLSLAGALVGALLAVPAVRLVSSFLWGVTSTDLATYVGVVAFFALVAALSSVLPALKVLRVDPAATLRD
jgi:predicted permease